MSSSISLQKISNEEIIKQIQNHDSDFERYTRQINQLEDRRNQSIKTKNELVFELRRRERNIKTEDVDDMKTEIDFMDEDEREIYRVKLNERIKQQENEIQQSKESMEKFRKDVDEIEERIKQLNQQKNIMEQRFKEQEGICEEEEKRLKKMIEVRKYYKERYISVRKSRLDGIFLILPVVKHMRVANELKKLIFVSRKYRQAIETNTKNFCYSNEKKEFIRELKLYNSIKDLTCDNFFLSTYKNEVDGDDIHQRIINAKTLNLKAIMPLQENLLKPFPNLILTSLSLSMQDYQPDFIRKCTHLKSISFNLEDQKFNEVFFKAMDEIKELKQLEKVYLHGNCDILLKKLCGFTMQANAVFSLKVTKVTEQSLMYLKYCLINDLTLCIEDDYINQSVYPYITRSKIIDGKQHYRIVLMPRGIINIDVKETLVNREIIRQIYPKSVIVAPGIMDNITGVEYTNQFINYTWESIASLSFQKIHFSTFFPQLSNDLQYVIFTECKLPEILELPRHLTALTINDCNNLHTLKINNQLKNLVIKKVHSLTKIEYETDDMNIPSLTHISFEQCQNLGSSLLPYSTQIFNCSYCKRFRIKNAVKFKFFNPVMWHILVQLPDFDDSN